MADDAYAAPELLVEPDWLAAHLDDPDIAIIDMDAPAGFARAHIPGAVNQENQNLKDAVNRRLVLRPDEAKPLFESLGIGADTLVIAYDNNRGLNAARLWWVLSYYGHDKIKVLNGGWRRWCDEGRAVETASRPARSTGAVFHTNERPQIRATVESMAGAESGWDTKLWDIRSKDEFIGANDRGNARKGHVPGAVHLEWADLVSEVDHTFKPAGELRALLAGIGIEPESVVYIY